MPHPQNVSYAPGPINARAAFIDDFEIVGMPAEQAPAAIERDRPYFVAQPGFERKLLPLSLGNGGAVITGGRYLFDTYAHAEAFKAWLTREFELDGQLFIDRPWIKDLSGKPFHVLGAHDFKDIHSAQIVVRLERWSLSDGHRTAFEQFWPQLRQQAADRDYSSLWMLLDDAGREAALVSVIDRTAAPDPLEPDVASLRALETRPSLGRTFEQQGWGHKTFDRTSWVYTLWFSPTHRPLALWPNSPPLPGLSPAEAAATVAQPAPAR